MLLHVCLHRTWDAHQALDSWTQEFLLHFMVMIQHLEDCPIEEQEVCSFLSTRLNVETLFIRGIEGANNGVVDCCHLPSPSDAGMVFWNLWMERQCVHVGDEREWPAG